MPIPKGPVALAALFCLGPGVALAQEAGPFINLEACRVTDAEIRLLATFEGSACHQVGGAEVYSERGTVIGVDLPVQETAEICTQQLVPVTTMQLVPATELVMELDVAAKLPDGRLLAEGSAEIVEDDPTCTYPEEQ